MPNLKIGETDFNPILARTKFNHLVGYLGSPSHSIDPTALCRSCSGLSMPECVIVDRLNSSRAGFNYLKLMSSMPIGAPETKVIYQHVLLPCHLLLTELGT